jgi:cell division protein FtsX
VRFIAGTTFGPAAPGVTDGRVVIAYAHDTATPAQLRRLAERIAALPEVEQYAFVDKDDALEFFRERFGESTTRQAVPLPQGFWMLLRAPGQASRVAAELTDEPALKQDGGAFSGVRPAREFYDWVDGRD